MPASEKHSLRRFYRAARRALSAEDQCGHAIAIADELMKRLDDGATVAAYLARDGEVDLANMIERCWRRCIVIAVPVLRGREMRFAEYRRGTPLERSRFGIAAPARPEWVTPTVVLAPLVAFDGRGHRLGMGGGYYDRFFAATPTTERIGIAHGCQRAAVLPVTSSDVPLTAVVTENGWRSFRNHGNPSG